jgi:spermidine synthase
LTRPWETLDAVETEEGRLELRRRGERDFVITVGGRVLMNSTWHRSEIAVAQLACRRIADRPRPHVLIGGLGMAFTLRAALDQLPRTAQVTVAEIEPAVVRWCRGPLAGLTEQAVDDPRVEIALSDVARLIAEAAGRFDAIVLDLYEGPRTATQAREDPFWGPAALRRTREALTPGGVFSVWSEDPDAAFEKRLASAGFRVERRRPESGGPRHAVYLAEALTPR